MAASIFKLHLHVYIAPLHIFGTMAPAAVPESVLRKRRRDDDWAAKRAAAGAEVSNAN